MTFQEARQEIKTALENQGFYVEGKENELVFSLTNLTRAGLSGVYAVIDEEEINIFLEKRLDELAEAKKYA